MVVVTAIGTSGPAVTSLQVEPPSHRFCRVAIGVGVAGSMGRFLLAGVGAGVAVGA